MKISDKDFIKLIRQKKLITAQTIADLLGISPRTVKNYVKNINAKFPGIIVSSNQGYSVNLDIAVQSSAMRKISAVPQTSKERIAYIENKLINSDYEDVLNLYDICEEIYVSLSTLKKDIQAVKKEMKKYDLELFLKGDEMKIIGSEKNRRKMLSAIIYKESGNNFINTQSIQSLFPDIDISFIKSTIMEAFNKANYFSNDYNLMNLVLHITIAINRIKNGNIGNNYQTEAEIFFDNSPEYAIVHNIAEKLEGKFSIHYTNAELQDLLYLISSRATSIDYRNITDANFSSIISEEYLLPVRTIIKKISDSYYIDFNNPMFIMRFALHIKNLAIRCKNNYYSKNPFTQEIKMKCPLIYDIALHTAQILENMLDITVNDDETAYIALHLGTALEENKRNNLKITAVLYCPNYYDISLKIVNKINQVFSDRLLITRIVTDEAELYCLQKIDLVISTITLTKEINIPLAEIQFFYTKQDEQKLFKLISELEKFKAKRKFETYIRQLITPDLIEINNNLTSDMQCIDYMVRKFIKLNYVDLSFKKDVIEREKLSSTAFENFAIPHSMKMNAKKTGINIIISDNPINWGSKSVQLVLMMCFNKNERQIFNEIYEPLTMALSEIQNVKSIVKCRTYEEFITKVVSLI